MSERTSRPTLRRRLLGLGAAVAAASMLVACSSSSESTTSASSSAAPSSEHLPAAEGKTSYPLTLTSPLGESTLKARPERIVALTATGNDVQMLQALKVTPVGATDVVETGAEAMGVTASRIEKLLDLEDAIPVEAVAALKPDLIIAYGPGVQDSYQRLASVAPVLTGKVTDAYPEWQDMITQIGQALDLSDAAAKTISDYDAWTAETKAAHPEFSGKTLSYLVYYAGQYGMNYESYTGSGAGDLFTSIGFTRTREPPSSARPSPRSVTNC